MSETTHKSLWVALLAFKAEVPPLPKDKVNPHFKSRYTPLDTIAERIDPLLTKHGLVWTALPGHQDGRHTLEYRLAHAASGEVLSGTMPLLLDKENSQGLGSALTYARRYAKTAVLDLVADEDDDGNAASRPAVAPHTADRLASVGQRKEILARSREVDMPPMDVANAILLAAGREPREFDSQDHAQEWVQRSLEKLPARMVKLVLAEINQMAAGVIG